MKAIKHSLLMIKKTYKNYILLSVTAFLSFGFMFIYLLYTDSEIYNEYKWVLSLDYKLAVSQNSNDNTTMRNLKRVETQLDKMPDTYYYYNKQCLARNVYGLSCQVYMYPGYVWGVFEGKSDGTYYGYERVKVNGEYVLEIGIGEAVVSEAVYNAIKETDDRKTITLIFADTDGKEFIKTFDIVGTYIGDSKSNNDREENTESDPVYINIGSVDTEKIVIDNIELVTHSERVDQVIEMLKDNSLACEEVKSIQNEALLAKRNAVENKYIIAIVLFVLLGINLYSSFENALNDRKYEIGVKRAIGAGKFDIMKQFTIEGLAVMLCNIVVAVFTMLNGMLVYKYILYSLKNEIYTIYISMESIILYAVFTFSMALVFSLLFAYRSTRVQIVKYLKEEQ